MAATSTRVARASSTAWFKPVAAIIAVIALSYALALLHVMTMTLGTMHDDIADMRGQLHDTTAELRTTNARLQIVNVHLIATNRELLQTNGKLAGTNTALRATIGHLAGTQRGVTAMKSDTAKMSAQLLLTQRDIRQMLGDIHQMTHRIVHAKLLF